MFGFRVGLFFILLTSFFSNGSMEYKGGTKTTPVIYDGSSIGFLQSDTLEPTGFVQKGAKREITEYYEDNREEYVEEKFASNTVPSSWTLLYRWILFGIFFGMIMGCCFGKRTFWTWLKDSKHKRLQRLNKITNKHNKYGKTPKPQASKPDPRPTVLAVKPPIQIMPHTSKSALESKTSQSPAPIEQIELEPIAGTSSQY